MNHLEPRPRVLYVTAGFPFPLSSGYLRHYHLLRQLASSHEVHLASITGPRFEPRDIEGVAGFVDRVSTFARSQRAGRLQRLGRLLSPGRTDGAVRALARAVDQAITREEVDVVVLTGKETAAAAEVIRGRVPLVVDLCDATSSRVTQEIELAGGIRRAGLLLRRRSMRRVEGRLIELADRLVTASERDRTALRAEGAPSRVEQATVIPNGVDIWYWQRSNWQLGSSVVFTGNLSYRPNADAARRLVSDVMPRVWSDRPDTEVVIVGLGASPSLRAALAQPRVTLTGAVDDVRPFLERAAVFVAPLRVAAGIQNKVLEAMAMEVPVVASVVAAGGLHLAGEAPPIAVGEGPAELAAFALDVLGRVDRDPTVDNQARAWVGKRFSWCRNGVALASVIQEARQPQAIPC